MKFNSNKTPNGHITVHPTCNGSSNTEQMLAEMERICTLTSSDAKAFLAFLSSYLVDELSRGRCVTLDEIGTFGISLSTTANDENKLTGHDVNLKRVVFRAAPQLKSQISEKISYERVSRDKRNSTYPRYTIDQRRALLTTVLAQYPQFTASQYSGVTYTSKATASRDLRLFVLEGLLVPIHIGNTIIYHKP